MFVGCLSLRCCKLFFIVLMCLFYGQVYPETHSNFLVIFGLFCRVFVCYDPGYVVLVHKSEVMESACDCYVVG